jgi:hypothetical protein
MLPFSSSSQGWSHSPMKLASQWHTWFCLSSWPTTYSILYGVASLSPLFYPESPLQTRLSSSLWYALCYAFKVDVPPMYSISDVQEQLATGGDSFQQPRQQGRVTRAIRWTCDFANELNEFEDLLTLIAIPGFASWQRPLSTYFLPYDAGYFLFSSGACLKSLISGVGSIIQVYPVFSGHILSRGSRTLVIFLSSCFCRILSLVVCVKFILIFTSTNES